MARTTETNYVPIKKYYILNPNVTNKTIAGKFNVSYGALRNHIHANNWKQERDEYYGDMATDFKEAAKNRDLIERDELDVRLKKNNLLMLDQVEKHLTRIGVGLDEDGKPTVTTEGVSVKDLNALAAIQKTVHDSEYRRLNVAAPKQPIEFEGADPFAEYQSKLAFEMARIKDGTGSNGNGADSDSDSEDVKLVNVKLEMPVTKN